MTDATLQRLFPLLPDDEPEVEEEISEDEARQREWANAEIYAEEQGRKAEEERELDEDGAWGRLAGLEF